MKKLSRYILPFALGALVLSSCEEKLGSDAISSYTYRFTLSSPDTKAVLASDENSYFTKWEEGDQLGVYTLNGDAEISYNRYGDIDIAKNPVEFTISSFKALTSGSEVYTYFPYDSSNSNGDAQNPSKVNLYIPVSQTGKMNDMPMVGTTYTVTEDIEAKTDKAVSDIKLYALGGIFQFNVFSTSTDYQSETVKSVAFTAEEAIAGGFVFDITQTKDLSITGNTEKTITTSANAAPGTAKDSGLKVNMVVKPGTYTGTLVVTTDAATYTYNVTTGKSVERAHIKPLNVDLAEGVRAEVEATEKYFVKVTSDLSDWSGKYLIVFSDNKAHSYVDGKDLVSSYNTELSISDNKILSDDNVNKDIVEVSSVTSGYTIKLSNAKYFTVPASNSCGSSTTGATITFTYTDKGVKILGTDSNKVERCLFKNSTYFRLYKSSSPYELPSLYKLED